MESRPIGRLGLVVHPRREIGGALDALTRWCEANGADLVQVPTPGQERHVAEPGDAADCDLIVALGGDGTTLAAVRAGAEADRPVLGAACGSLGALTTVTADELPAALDRVAAGEWTARNLPTLTVEYEDAERTAVNDLVVVRQGAGQVSVSVRVDDQLFTRFAGDGFVVGTPLGSSAYTLAAGGPLLAPGALGMVFTPLAPHGGFIPPLVSGPEGRLDVEVDPGHGGARLELDGQIGDLLPPLEPAAVAVTLAPGRGTLVSLGEDEPMFAGLRRRRILIDSPRILARDDREAAEPV
jgi:NAD+ kinase